MITPQLAIIDLLSRRRDSALTINQLAKLVGKSYAYTNKYVHELLGRGILTKRDVGSAMLCSLDFSHEESIGHLILLSIRRRLRLLEEGEVTEAAVENLLQDEDRSGIIALYLEGSVLTVISETRVEERRPTRHRSPSVAAKRPIALERRTPAEFKRAATEMELDRLVVLKGHETFWRLVAETR